MNHACTSLCRFIRHGRRCSLIAVTVTYFLFEYACFIPRTSIIYILLHVIRQERKRCPCSVLFLFLRRFFSSLVHSIFTYVQTHERASTSPIYLSTTTTRRFSCAPAFFESPRRIASLPVIRQHCRSEILTLTNLLWAVDHLARLMLRRRQQSDWRRVNRLFCDSQKTPMVCVNSCARG